MPLISVVTVCYNSEKTIKKTIESVLMQDFSDFEYLIIDGKSTDKTCEIIKSFVPKFNARGIELRWISEPDSGIYNAMNKGIRHTTGNYIGLLNSDDTYDQRTLSLIASAISKDPGIDVFHGLLRYLSDGKLTMIRGQSSNRLNEGMFEHPTCFVSRKAYEKFGIFDERYKFVADYELMLRFKNSGAKFKMIERILANFDENGAGNSYYSRRELISLQRRYKLKTSIVLFAKLIRLAITEISSKKK